MQKLLFSPYKAVIFDLDNTLMDFVQLMLRGAEAAVKYLGIGTTEELIGYYLRGIHHIEDHLNLQDFMLDYDCFTPDAYFNAVKVFDAAKYENAVPYAGIPAVLQQIKDAGLTMGIVTDAFTYSANERLEKSGLAEYFSFVVGFEQTGYKKPHHEPFEYALSLAECEPFEAAFVGDSIRRDINPAMAIGMTGIHARYGDRNHIAPEGFVGSLPHTLIAEKPEDILSLLKINVVSPSDY